MKVLALSLIATLSLAGCEYNGMTRAATVDDIDSECIYAAVSSVPGMEKVIDVGAEMRDVSSRKNHPMPYSLYYTNGAARAWLMLDRERHDFRQYNLYPSALDQMPAEEVIATRSLMMQVEHQVEDRCGVVGLTSSVKERCGWKTCK